MPRRAEKPPPPDLAIDTSCPQPVCGVDEAGRGPLAGPVVAAAVILDPARMPAGIDDSKALTETRRERLFDAIMVQAKVGIGRATVAEIGQLNILQASLLAMRRAVLALPAAPAFALIDGNRLPDDLPCPARAVIGGDRRAVSIAAASIIAKVTRDREMREIARRFPDYGFEAHKGYGTAAHLAALNRLGPCPEHRLDFAPVRLVRESLK